MTRIACSSAVESRPPLNATQKAPTAPIAGSTRSMQSRMRWGSGRCTWQVAAVISGFAVDAETAQAFVTLRQQFVGRVAPEHVEVTLHCRLDIVRHHLRIPI